MAEIDQLRKRMDEITIDMVRLLKSRTDIAESIGRIKSSTGAGVTDEAREDSLREKIADIAGEIGLDGSAASRLLNFLINDSVRVQSAGKQTHLSVFRKAKEIEASGRKIIHMEVGEPDFMPPKEAGDALCGAYERGMIRYGQAAGMPAYRQAVAAYISKRFGTETGPENILASPGARFSVFSAITTLLDPGDEMILIEPAWPAYKDCALHAGIKVRTVSTTLEDKWNPSIRQISKMINGNTRMIVLNYPNNPTGKILSSALQDEIVSIAMDHSLYVLSDEIYSDYAYSDWKSILSYGYDKSIITQSFSKSHAMTGFRIGYSIASPGITRKMSEMSALCLTNVAEPLQYAAISALGADTSGNANMVKSRLDLLSDLAGKAGLESVRPDGAMYLYVRAGPEGFDGTKLAYRLLEHGLAVAPGEGFGNYRNFIRISACQNENVLMQGMNILSKELDVA